MKKLIYILMVVSLLIACEDNTSKMFLDSDANVYFPTAKVGVPLGEVLSIPINLSNIAQGRSVTVSIRLKDSTAVEGRDYELLSGREYTFEKGLGTEFIVIRALAKTGKDSLAKRLFTITLEPVEGLRPCIQNQMTVELRNYSNHPLFKLLGDAEFVGLDLVQGNVEIKNSISIYPDDDSETTIWLSGMTAGTFGGTLPDLRLEVDTLRKKVTLPYQSFVNRKQGNMVGDLGTFRGVLQGNQVMIEKGAAAVFSYDKDGNILMDDWFGTWWEKEQEPLFIYYGFYAGVYNTAILKPKK